MGYGDYILGKQTYFDENFGLKYVAEFRYVWSIVLGGTPAPLKHYKISGLKAF